MVGWSSAVADWSIVWGEVGELDLGGRVDEEIAYFLSC
jgi:hypothetical protein